MPLSPSTSAVAAAHLVNVQAAASSPIEFVEKFLGQDDEVRVEFNADHGPGLVDQPGAAGALFQRGPDGRVQPGQRAGQRAARHPAGGQVDAVEPGRMLADRVGAAAPDILDDGPDGGQGRVHVKLGPREHPGQLTGAQLAGGLTSKIDSHQHPSSLREPPAAPRLSKPRWPPPRGLPRAGPGDPRDKDGPDDDN